MKHYQGSYHMTGYVSNEKGEYPIAMNITINIDGTVSGRYNYDLTVKKYGDVPSSYIYLIGNVDHQGNIIMTSRMYGKEDPFENITLQFTKGKEYLDGWLENCKTHSRYSVSLSSAESVK